jgi:hypothetical protein
MSTGFNSSLTGTGFDTAGSTELELGVTLNLATYTIDILSGNREFRASPLCSLFLSQFMVIVFPSEMSRTCSTVEPAIRHHVLGHV